ncbi:MAG: (d)CMP kinase [Anaerolineaceae bacterium]|nr:(d)CMP kinase [Anaerolineaceae bacterium]
MKSKQISTLITIDGPAAVGKTTVGRLVAEALGFICFDTGVMYRALTFAVGQNGLDYHDETAVSRLAWEVEIDILPPSVEDGRLNDVMVNGRDLTWEIRSPDVNKWVSEVSAYPQVRQAMTEQQRKIAAKGSMVILGRDIGSVVIPDAPCKIYLDASPEIRAKRRFAEESSQGSKISYQQVLSSIRHRDELDGSRKTAPLVIPKEALVILTDGLGAEAVAEKVLTYYQGCLKRLNQSPDKE